MSVYIDARIRDTYLAPFGLSNQLVEEAVRRPTQSRIIKMDDTYSIGLFLKNYRDYTMFVYSKQNLDNSSLVKCVYVLDNNFLKNIDTSNPILVLEKIANEFGYDLRISDQQGRFINDVSIKIPDSENIDPRNILSLFTITENNEPADEYDGDLIAKSNTLEGTLFLDIALAYFININRYAKYVRSNILNSP